ncbi:MAG: alpha/beta hydrolase [Firmicutes bacterium]|nr:alpha/beta hydrolase [Bacillota bacterium]
MKREELEKCMKTLMHRAVPYFDDAPCYPTEELIRLFRLERDFWRQADLSVMGKIAEEYRQALDSLKMFPDAPEKIWLWPEGKMPESTVYTDNSEGEYNHEPGYRPYMFAMPVPEDVCPKGAVVVCAGGDHGEASFHEGYFSCLDLNRLGYQCFLLLNRVNMRPWSREECGADAARAIRIVRADAEKYRILPNRVAFAGFSNGGLTGEACIERYSGRHTVREHFPGYEPDELDDYKGAPDAFLCVYGPRFAGAAFDYEGVEYPPVFFAVGREDSALQNLNAAYFDLLKAGVKAEVHTFAGVPHGQAGMQHLGEEKFGNFQLWLPLADAFMQDVYAG